MDGFDMLGAVPHVSLTAGHGGSSASVKGAVQKLQASAKNAQSKAKKLGTLKSKSSKPSSVRARQTAAKLAAKVSQLASAASKHASALQRHADQAAKASAAKSQPQKAPSVAPVKRGAFQQASKASMSRNVSRGHVGGDMVTYQIDPSKMQAAIANMQPIIDIAMQFGHDVDDASLMADVASTVQPYVDQLNTAGNTSLASQGTQIITNANNFAQNIQNPPDPSTSDGSGGGS